MHTRRNRKPIHARFLAASELRATLRSTSVATKSPPKPIDNTTSMAPDYDSFYTSILGLTNAAYGYAQQHRGMSIPQPRR